MIVAVTGGTGFIGKRLLERLSARGDTVRVITRRPEAIEKFPRIETFKCDLQTASVEELAGILRGADVFYHCAGQIVDESAMRTLHVGATRKLTEAASGHIGQWVQLSSVGVYGPLVGGIVTERTLPAPRGEYETTKAEADRLVLESSARGNFKCTVLRPSNVYGAGMNNRSLYGLIEMVRRGLFFFIGSPGAAANYIHVDNVAEALLVCGTTPHGTGEIFNLSDQRTMEQFISIISAALGKNVPGIRLPEAPVRILSRILGRIPGFPLTEARVDALTRRVTYSCGKIQRELGYTHRISMEEGLTDLVQYWLETAKGGSNV